MKEVMEEAYGLELKPGLHDVKYSQKFVRAKMETYPCNYVAEKVNPKKILDQTMKS